MSKIPFIVVPNWNGKSYLKDCLHSLERQTAKHQVIVVDNGSTDGSVVFVKEHFPQVQVVELAKNRGFAGGVNAGIKAALKKRAEFIALFNNDAEAHPQWLAALLKRMRQSGHIGIVTGKILQRNGTIDSVGEAYSIWAQPFPIGRGQRDKSQFDEPRKITAASGGASLYRAKMLKQIGLLDEAFFAYYEDVDISLRAQSQGWEVWYEPAAIVHHQVGATSSKLAGFANYHRFKNMFYLYDKNLPPRLFWRYLPRKIMSGGLTKLHLLRQGQFGAVFKALLVLLISAPGLYLKRRQIKNSRKISDDEFDRLLYHGGPPTSRTLSKLSKIFDRKYQP